MTKSWDSGTKFYYVRDAFWPGSNAHITVAFRVVKSDEDKISYEFGGAFSAPQERFVKKTGRLISEGRMNKRTFLRSVERNSAEKGVYRQVIEDIQQNAIKTLVEEHQPEWWMKLSKQKKLVMRSLVRERERLEQIIHMMDSGSFEPKPWEV